jgi:hypothetical protein
MLRKLCESSLRLLAAATLACTITSCRVATAPLPTETPTTMPVVRYTPTQMPTLDELYTPTLYFTPTPTNTPTPPPTTTPTPYIGTTPRKSVI